MKKKKAAQASQELYALQSAQGINIDFLSHIFVCYQGLHAGTMCVEHQI